MPYGGYGMAGGTFQPIRGLSKWLINLMYVTIAGSVITLFAQILLRDSARDYINNSLSSSEFTSKAGLYVGVGLLLGVVGIAQTVLLIIWAFRMAKNHLVLGRLPQSFSAGATIAVNILGGCTLGILNFFMWTELWKASDPETAPGDSSWKQRSSTPLLAIYLAGGLINVVGAIALGLSGFGAIRLNSTSTKFAESLNDRLALVLLIGAIGVATNVIFLMFVKQISARHMKATREA